MKRLVTALLLVVASCGDEAPVAPGGPTAGPVPPVPENFGSPSWVSVAGGDTVLAHVGQAPITRSMLERQRQAHPDMGDRELLDRLIEREVLAQHAVREGLASTPDVVQAWRDALARQVVEGVFEADNGPEAITLESIRRLWPRLREQYDHADAWKAAQIAINCCDARREDCGQAAVVECFAAAGSLMDRLYPLLKERIAGLEGDPKLVAEAMEAFKNELVFQYPQLTYGELSFYYDPDKPHAEQRGYNIVDPAFARTVIDGELGVLQPPVQSGFGWHLITKLEHRPERHGSLDDPEVIADIRANALERWREQAFGVWMGELMKKHKVQVDEATMKVLERASN